MKFPFKKSKKVVPLAQPKPETLIIEAIEALGEKFEAVQMTRDIELVDSMSERFDILSDKLEKLKSSKSVETEEVVISNPTPRSEIHYNHHGDSVQVDPHKSSKLLKEKKQ